MGWFQIAATPSGREFSVVIRRTGELPDLRSPGAANKAAGPSIFDWLTLPGLISRLINFVVYRGSWTVEVAPWKGLSRPKRKIRVTDEAAAEASAEKVYRLIEAGQWDPAEQPEPPQA